MCLPRFDSDPVFGRLVGGQRAGSFTLAPKGALGVTRRYREGSAVLETRWQTSSGDVTLTDGLVLHATGRLVPQVLLVRRLEARGEPARIRVLFDPRAGLRGGDLRSERRREGESGGQLLGLGLSVAVVGIVIQRFTAPAAAPVTLDNV